MKPLLKAMNLLRCLAAVACAMPSELHAAEPPLAASEPAPKWKLLGDDDGLRATIRQAGQIVLLCVYQTELREVKPPFAEVVIRATVVEAMKGDHAIGDRISVQFPTDSLPMDTDQQKKFIESAALKNLGALKIAFLSGTKSQEYSSEWLYVPGFMAEMASFIRTNVKDH